MVVFPNAKINLGLRILNRRKDGYHNIQSVLYPIPFTDILEINKSDTFNFRQGGNPLDSSVEDNLCMRAIRSMESHIGRKLPPISIDLEKLIPSGAGLGGGSSDASYTLSCINKLFDLGVSRSELHKLASTLGADCPFFLNNKPALVTGTGTELHDISLSLKGFFLCLIKPDIHISTAEAYSRVNISGKDDVKDVLQLPVSHWKDKLINDFEKHLFVRYPELMVIKKKLYEKGAAYSSMSGSGSSMFGIFHEKKEIRIGDHKVYWFELSL